MIELDLSGLPPSEELTDDQRDELVRHALGTDEGPVTRFVASYEQALADGGMKISFTHSDDPPWISLGLARYLSRALEDEVVGSEPA